METRPSAAGVSHCTCQTFTYDNNLSFGIGRLNGVTDESGTTSYAYNYLGQILTHEVVITGDTYTTEYAYNIAGQLTNVMYSNDLEALYTYDTQGRIDSVSVIFEDGSIQALASNITYQPFGPMAGFEYGNGMNHTRIFDQDYRLTAQNVGTLLDRRYTYDTNGNITSIDIQESDLANQAFAFDSVDRIAQASGTEGNRGYFYDLIGNRTQFDVNNQSSFYAYATGSNRLEEITGQTNRTLTLDTAGSTITDIKSANTLTSIYNHQNRLASLGNGAISAEYRYNAMGQRVQKTVDDKTTRFVFDRTGALLQEFGANKTKTYFYLAGQPLAVITKNTQTTTANYSGPHQRDHMT